MLLMSINLPASWPLLLVLQRHRRGRTVVVAPMRRGLMGQVVVGSGNRWPVSSSQPGLRTREMEFPGHRTVVIANSLTR